MSYSRFIDPTYYYDNPTLGFSTPSETYVVADSNITIPLEEGNYLFDYTAKCGSDKVTKAVSFRILIDGNQVDEWIKESKDGEDRMPLTGTSKLQNLAAGTHTVMIEAKGNMPAEAIVDSFRFTLKRWG